MSSQDIKPVVIETDDDTFVITQNEFPEDERNADITETAESTCQTGNAAEDTDSAPDEENLSHEHAYATKYPEQSDASPRQILACGKCDEVFFSALDMATHMKNHGKKNKPVDVVTVGGPVIEQPDVTPSSCRVIANFSKGKKKETKKKSIIDTIMKAQGYSDKGKFICVPCKKPFQTAGSLSDHMRRVHNEATNALTLFKCDPCNKIFTKEKWLKHHTDTYHKSNTTIVGDPLSLNSAPEHSNQIQQRSDQFIRTPWTQGPSDIQQRSEQFIVQSSTSQAASSTLQALAGKLTVLTSPAPNPGNYVSILLPESARKIPQSPASTQSSSPQAVVDHSNVILCDICGMNFDSNTNLRRHKNTVHEKPNPSKQSTVPKSTVLETLLGHKGNEQKCFVCNEPHSSISDDPILQNIKIEAGVDDPSQRKSACALCKQTFSNAESVAYLKNILNEKEYSERLGRYRQLFPRTLNTKDLVRPEISHRNNERRYTCDICNQAFIHPASVQTHKELFHARILQEQNAGVVSSLQTSEENYGNNTELGNVEDTSCDVPVQFAQPRTDDADTTCPICGRNYSSQFCLRRHISMVHEKSWPPRQKSKTKTKAPSKNKTSPQKSKVSPHKSASPSRSASAPVPSSGGAHFSCDACGQTFKLRFNLNKHKRLYHTQKKYNNNRVRTLILYSKINHTDRGFRCTLCDQFYAHRRILGTHQLKRHPAEYQEEMQKYQQKEAEAKAIRQAKIPSPKSPKHSTTQNKSPKSAQRSPKHIDLNETRIPPPFQEFSPEIHLPLHSKSPDSDVVFVKPNPLQINYIREKAPQPPSISPELAMSRSRAILSEALLKAGYVGNQNKSPNKSSKSPVRTAIQISSPKSGNKSRPSTPQSKSKPVEKTPPKSKPKPIKVATPQPSQKESPVPSAPTSSYSPFNKHCPLLTCRICFKVFISQQSFDNHLTLCDLKEPKVVLHDISLMGIKLSPSKTYIVSPSKSEDVPDRFRCVVRCERLDPRFPEFDSTSMYDRTKLKRRRAAESDNQAKGEESDKQTPEGMFSCAGCGKEYVKEGNLRLHEALCASKASGASSSKKQKMDLQQKDAVFPCGICGKEFVKERSMNIHITISHCNVYKETDKFSCNICGKEFDKEKNMTIHKTVAHRNDSKNNSCARKINFDKQGPTKQSHAQKLLKLAKMKLGSDKGSSSTHKCNICSKVFSHKHHVERHMLSTHPEDLFQENIAEVKKMSLAAAYICDICKEEFKKTTDVKYHKMKVHPKEYAAERKEEQKNVISRHYCEFCNKKFSKWYNVRPHQIRIHPKELFAKLKKSREALQKVVKAPEKDVPEEKEVDDYTCEFCEKVFTEKRSVRRHQENLHPKEYNEKLKQESKRESKKNVEETSDEDTEEQSEDEVHRCDICNKRFLHKENIIPHKLKYHAKKLKQKNQPRNGLSCPICKMTFAQRSSVHRHMKNLHKKKNNLQIKFANNTQSKPGFGLTKKCIFCKKEFSSRNGLCKHQRLTHPKEYKKLKAGHSFRKSNKDSKVDQSKQESNPDSGTASLVARVERSKPKCSVCMKMFSDAKILQRHMKLFHSIDQQTHSKVNAPAPAHVPARVPAPAPCTQFKCKCGVTFLIQKDLIKHQQQNHLVKAKKGVMKCGLCSKPFSSRGNVFRHMKQAHINPVAYFPEAPNVTTNEYPCDPELFDERVNQLQTSTPTLKDTFLTSDVEIKEEKIPCELCMRVFVHQSSLEKHMMLVHPDIAEFPCDICHKVFEQRATLKRHKKTVHADVYRDDSPCSDRKPAEIKIESKTSEKSKRSAPEDKAFMRFITEFPCNICHKVFMRKASVKQHKKVFHADVYSEGSPDSPASLASGHSGEGDSRIKASEDVSADPTTQQQIECDKTDDSANADPVAPGQIGEADETNDNENPDPVAPGHLAEVEMCESEHVEISDSNATENMGTDEKINPSTKRPTETVSENLEPQELEKEQLLESDEALVSNDPVAIIDISEDDEVIEGPLHSNNENSDKTDDFNTPEAEDQVPIPITPVEESSDSQKRQTVLGYGKEGSTEILTVKETSDFEPAESEQNESLEYANEKEKGSMSDNNEMESHVNDQNDNDLVDYEKEKVSEGDVDDGEREEIIDEPENDSIVDGKTDSMVDGENDTDLVDEEKEHESEDGDDCEEEIEDEPKTDSMVDGENDTDLVNEVKEHESEDGDDCEEEVVEEEVEEEEIEEVEEEEIEEVEEEEVEEEEIEEVEEEEVEEEEIEEVEEEEIEEVEVEEEEIEDEPKTDSIVDGENDTDLVNEVKEHESEDGDDCEEEVEEEEVEAEEIEEEEVEEEEIEEEEVEEEEIEEVEVEEEEIEDEPKTDSMVDGENDTDLADEVKEQESEGDDDEEEDIEDEPKTDSMVDGEPEYHVVDAYETDNDLADEEKEKDSEGVDECENEENDDEPENQLVDDGENVNVLADDEKEHDSEGGDDCEEEIEDEPETDSMVKDENDTDLMDEEQDSEIGDELENDSMVDDDDDKIDEIDGEPKLDSMGDDDEQNNEFRGEEEGQDSVDGDVCENEENDDEPENHLVDDDEKDNDLVDEGQDSGDGDDCKNISVDANAESETLIDEESHEVGQDDADMDEPSEESLDEISDEVILLEPAVCKSKPLCEPTV